MSFETLLYNTAGNKVKLYHGSQDNDEVTHPYTSKVLQMIQNHFNINLNEAYLKLVNSDIDNPIWIDNDSFWVE